MAITLARIKAGRIIRRFRLRLGQTQAEFGCGFNVTQSVVSEWEGGTRIPSYPSITYLAGMVTRTESAVLTAVAESAKLPRRRAVQAQIAPPSVSSIIPAAEGCNG